ncbi:MAG: DUF2141 domain-containing protein [Spirochaetaceae bacterium]|nr:DUF2141 domain-containing protein [Spirochaetaceae bacterium]
MNLKRLIGGLSIAIVACFSLSAQPQYTISGSVTYAGEGLIYIYLLDEEIARIPLTGIQTLVLTPDESAGILTFAFADITAGTYGIRCYQDTNGNGELDRGVFGPKEPWGMSWQGDKPPKWPRWDHFSFGLMTDISGIAIVLEE